MRKVPYFTVSHIDQVNNQLKPLTPPPPLSTSNNSSDEFNQGKKTIKEIAKTPTGQETFNVFVRTNDNNGDPTTSICEMNGVMPTLLAGGSVLIWGSCSWSGGNILFWGQLTTWIYRQARPFHQIYLPRDTQIPKPGYVGLMWWMSSSGSIRHFILTWSCQNPDLSPVATLCCQGTVDIQYSKCEI